MNIAGVFLNNELRTGGHLRYLELVDGLAQRGNRVVVLVNSRLDRPPTVARVIPCEARYRRRSFPPASWVFARTAARHAAQMARLLESPDVVVVHGETHLRAGHRLARAMKVPLVYGHRSNTVREYLTYLSETGPTGLDRAAFWMELVKSRLDERRIARLADRIVFQSPFDRDDFIRRLPSAAAKAVVIRGNIGGPRFPPAVAAANASTALRNVVFIGTLGIRKGVDYLVEAIVLLARRGLTALSFEICGPGDRRDELAARLMRAGVPNAVSFPGRVPSAFPHLVAADLLVVPSLFDSYPDTVLEALHVGVPVIGSRVGGIPDILQYDDLLVPAMDGLAIADRIERAVREPAFYQAMRRQCAERRAAFQFDWTEAWERAMRELQVAAGQGRANGSDARNT